MYQKFIPGKNKRTKKEQNPLVLVRVEGCWLICWFLMFRDFLPPERLEVASRPWTLIRSYLQSKKWILWMRHSNILSWHKKRIKNINALADGETLRLLMQFISLLDQWPEIWQKGVMKILNPLSTGIYTYSLFSLTSSIEGAIFKLINSYWVYF